MAKPADVPQAEYDAVMELHRLYKEAPDIITDLITFLRSRPHTASATLRIHGGRLQCVELLKVTRQEGTKGTPA